MGRNRAQVLNMLRTDKLHNPARAAVLDILYGTAKVDNSDIPLTLSGAWGELSDSTFKRIVKHLPRLGAGVSRECFELNDRYVVKVAHFGDYANLMCNKAELDSWLHVRNSRHSGHFARVIACSPTYEWIVMEKAHKRLSNEKFEKWYWSVGEQLSRMGVTDIHGGNVMEMRNGRIVMVDYGFTRELRFA